MSRPARLAVLAAVVCAVLVAAGVWLGMHVKREPPARVAGPSMAPRLVGTHYCVTCEDCGFPFAFGVESPPMDGYAVCPNCGAQDNDVSAAEPLPGQEVCIDRGEWRVSGPQRWRMAAFRQPGNTQRLNVKRIVGLPGEQIAIRGGEIYVDGQMLRKSLPELRDVAVLVHDNRYHPVRNPSLPSRWSPADSNTGWVVNGTGGFEHRPPNAGSEPDDPNFDWLEYHHWPALPPPTPRTQSSAVHDHFAYNQGESRLLNEVRDLMLHCRLSMAGAGGVSLRIHDGRGVWELHFDAESRKAALWFGGKAIREVAERVADEGATVEIELALLDGRILAAFDGTTVLVHEVSCPPHATSSLPLSRPVAIGAVLAEVEVSELRIYRDLYFLHPWGHAADWEMDGPLSRDEIFVLGDNCPLSNDSRNWEQPGLPISNVLGYVDEVVP